jgi:hydroxypyruvate reductase
MTNSCNRTEHAKQIWQAGVDAVDSGRLLKDIVALSGHVLTICGTSIDLRQLSRIVVVGAGKAGAGMAGALEEILSSEALQNADAACEVLGWVNVPADCVRPLPRIILNAARPAGVNEPTAEGVEGSQRILELVHGLEDSDLCLVVLSGGGSALLPAPVDGISLQDKQTITQLLMRGGATINELNCVRKQLSQIKGGGLARASRAGQMVALVISDVIGDPLDVIASGPTVDDSSTPGEALEIISRVIKDTADVPLSILDRLRRNVSKVDQHSHVDGDRVRNLVIGNNEFAVRAASAKAAELGYRVVNQGCGMAGVAAEVGRNLAEACLMILKDETAGARPVCVLSGGEPVVQLADTNLARKGGRNQELVLAACQRLWVDGADNLAILSGGTDGEDGPTDAAGAFLDSFVIDEARRLGLQPADFLAINTSYEFFEQAGGLLKTGPTHTNVMDLRVAVVGRCVTRL